MNGATLGGAGSTFARANSMAVAPTAFRARITSSTLLAPVTRGSPRKLEVATPSVSRPGGAEPRCTPNDGSERHASA